MFCAGPEDGSADTCGGDSGGAVVDRGGSSNPAQHRQAGIVSWGLGCAIAGFPGVYVRLDSFSGFIEQEGYCGCSSLAPNGTSGQPSLGCSAAVLQAEQQAGLQGLSTGAEGQAACYVIAPARCPYSVPSVLHPGAALALCSSDSNLTYAAEPLPLARSALAPGALAPLGEVLPLPQSTIMQPGALAPGGEHMAEITAMHGVCGIGPPCTRQCCLQAP